MSHDLEKYLYFQVGLLKNSFAVEALWQDALKYHLIDEPGKLIAFRLTEYYEMMAQGSLHPGANGSLAATHTASGNGEGREGMATENATGITGASPVTLQAIEQHPDQESIITASPDMEGNADEAAEYWASL